MRKLLSLLLVFAMLFSMVAVTSAAEEDVVLEVAASKDAILPGEEVTLYVQVTNKTSEPITAIGFRLDIPEELTYVSHTDHFPEYYEGKLEADGTETAYNYESNYNVAAQNYAAYGDTAITDAAWTLLSITCKASGTVAAGELDIALERDDYLSIGNSSYESVEFTAKDGKVSVLTAVASPIEIGGLVAPVKGETAVTAVTLPAGLTGTLTWKNGENVHTGIFAPGASYVAEIAYTVADGYALPADVTVTAPEGATSAIMDVANSLIKVTYPTTGGLISGELTVDLTAPVPGGKPQAAVSGEVYSGAVTWNAGTFFDDNTAYTANVVLTANEGYVFASDVTVAGIDAVEVAADGSTVSFSKTFAATGDHPSYYWTFDAEGNFTNVTTDGWAANALHADKGWDNGELTAEGVVNGSLAMTTHVVLPADEAWTIEWQGGGNDSYNVVFAQNDKTADASAKAAEWLYLEKAGETFNIRLVTHGSHNNVAKLEGISEEIGKSADTIFYVSHDGEGNLTIKVENGETKLEKEFSGVITRDFVFNSVKGFYIPSVTATYGNNMRYAKITREALVKEITGELDLGITAPVSGATPEPGVVNDLFDADIVWNDATPEFFAEETVYTAHVTVTPANENDIFAQDVTIAGSTDAEVSADGKSITATITYPATEKITGYYWDFDGSDYTYVTGNGYGVNELSANEIVSGALDMARPVTLRNDQMWTIEWKGGAASAKISNLHVIPLAYNTVNDEQNKKEGAFLYICGQFDKEDDTNKICIVPAGVTDSHTKSIFESAIVNNATVLDSETIWNISYDGNGNMTITVTLGETVQTFTEAVSFEELSFNGVKGYLWNDTGCCADDSMDYMKITFRDAGIGGEVDLNLEAPVSGAAPVTSVENAKYTASILWNDANPEFFAEETVYTANITLTAIGAEFFNKGVVIKDAENVVVSEDGKTVTATITYPATEKIIGYYWDFTGSDYESVIGNGYGVNELTPNAVISSTMDMAREIVLKNDQPWTIEWKGGVPSTGKVNVVPLAFNTPEDEHPKAGAYIYICSDFDKADDTNKVCLIPAGKGGVHGDSIISNAIVNNAVTRDPNTVWTITYDGNGTLSVIVTLGDSIQVFREDIGSKMPDFTFNGVKGYLWAANGYGADDTLDYMKITYTETEIPGEARIGDTYYATLAEAIAAAPAELYPTEVATATTITLLKDVNSGFDVGVEKYPYATEFRTQNIVLDLDGHTLTLGHPPVGSDALLKTHGLRVLAYSQLTIQDGTVTSDSNEVLNLMANYGKLTLNNVDVNTGSAVSIAINNRGALTLGGNTNVENGKAGNLLAISNSPYDYPETCDVDASLTVTSADVVVGDVFVELYDVVHGSTSAVNNGTVAVNISAGNFGSLMVDGTDKEPKGNVTGGTFSAKVPEKLCAEGYMPTDDGNGKYTVQQGASVSGTITSFGKDASAVVTVELISQGETVKTTTVTGNTAAYTIESVLAGEYTVKVSKDGHVSREYTITVGTEDVTQDAKICLKGDVTGDGRVNILDVNKLFGIANQAVEADDYAKACGEVTGDTRVNILDVNRLFKFVNQQIDTL